jgi:hypothetical protein
MFGSLLAALAVSGVAQAVANNVTGSMTVTMSAANVPAFTWGGGGGAQICWAVGDTITYTDTEFTDNRLNGVPVVVNYYVDLNSWIGGAFGALIQNAQITHNVAAGGTATTNLVVTGTYNGWNGAGPIAPCAVGVPITSFQVYKKIGVNAPVSATNQIFY